MTSLAQRVVARFRRGKTIPLDKANIKREADRLAHWVAKYMGLNREVPGPIGARKWDGLDSEIEARTVHGDFIKVPIHFDSVPSHTDHLTAGGYTMIDYDPEVTIHLNATKTYADFASMGGEYKDGAKGLSALIYETLIHELTHVAEADFITSEAPMIPGAVPGTDYDKVNKKNYYNQPHEVRAYMQQIVDQVMFRSESINFKRLFKTPNEYVMGLLKNSTRWKQVEPYLTETNKDKIMKVVYQALDEAGKFSGASV